MALITNITNYWKLDGTSNDSVGSLNGTDTSITYPTGKINQGAGFDSSTDKITFANTTLISGTSSFTLSFWIKYTSGLFIIHRRNTSPPNNGWQVVYNSSRIYFQFSSQNIFFADAISLDSNWHHIVITRSGSSWAMYKDGISVATATDAGSIGSGDTLRFGDTGDAGGSAIMTLDEVGVWSRALTSGEVTQLYNSGNGLQYPFNYSISLTSASFAITVNNVTLSIGYTLAIRTASFVLNFLPISFKRSIIWSNQSKNSATFSNQSKNTSTWSNQIK